MADVEETDHELLAELDGAIDDEKAGRLVDMREVIARLGSIPSNEPGDPDAASAWSDEIRRRVDEIEAGTAELEDWETVRLRLEAARRT